MPITIGLFLHSDPNYVYVLHKALYGLKQAPRAWYECLREFFLKNGFVMGKADLLSSLKK